MKNNKRETPAHADDLKSGHTLIQQKINVKSFLQNILQKEQAAALPDALEDGTPSGAFRLVRLPCAEPEIHRHRIKDSKCRYEPQS
jgi:hypothetical protein